MRFAVLAFLALSAAVAVAAASGCGGDGGELPTAAETPSPESSPSTPTVTDAPEPASTPSDGASKGQIAFVSFQSNYDIFVMSADGSSQTNLTNDPADDFHPAWSPDGTRIAYTTHDIIYVMNADGSGVTRLTDDPSQYETNPDWSPDGSRIAFVSNRDGNNEVYVMNADGSNITRLTDDVDLPGPAGAVSVLPAWSPDGTRIAFISNRRHSWDLYMMNADGSNQTLLMEGVEQNSAPTWSPDGEHIAFAGGLGPRGIYVIDVNDSTVTRLTEGGDFEPSWSPDGTHIAFASNRDRNFEIYVMNADGSGQTRLTDDPAQDTHPAWSPVP